MKVLVTAGNTLVPIDRVRCITNIFTGRTGTHLALAAHERGHSVTLLTSHPEVVAGLQSPTPQERWTVCPYRTFDDLEELLGQGVTRDAPDAIIHSAAVSDYRAAGVYAPAPGTSFAAATLRWERHDGTAPQLADMAAAKVKSDAAELWLRLVRAPKLVDRLRADYGFAGVLVKFKLEAGVTEERLLEIAEGSRLHSQADLIVANTLEGASSWAYLGPLGSGYQRLDRAALAQRLLEAVERLHGEKRHG